MLYWIKQNEEMKLTQKLAIIFFSFFELKGARIPFWPNLTLLMKF